MTMGSLRVSLLITYVVISGVVVWVGSAIGRFDAVLAAVLAGAVLLCLPTLRLGRVSLDARVATLGILPAALLVFVLGAATPVLLVLAPWVGVVAFVLFLVAYVVFDRRVSSGLSRDHTVLRPSSGDADVGAFTPLTPMLPPPIMGAGPPAGESHSRYDASAVRDPLAEWTRTSRHDE